jgi:hypothetical protein
MPSADNVGAAFDFAIEALDGIGGVQLGAVSLRKSHEGQNIVLGTVHQGGEFGDLQLDCASARNPITRAVAIAAHQTIRVFVAICRARAGTDLHLDQALTGEPLTVYRLPSPAKYQRQRSSQAKCLASSWDWSLVVLSWSKLGLATQS